jgi:hypothetical protein
MLARAGLYGIKERAPTHNAGLRVKTIVYACVIALRAMRVIHARYPAYALTRYCATYMRVIARSRARFSRALACVYHMCDMCEKRAHVALLHHVGP